MDIKEKRATLKRYVKRNMQLYLFWFIILLPFTIVLRGWYEGSVLTNLISVCKHFVFSSTFPVSWYIMASVIGTTLICFMCKYLNCIVIFIFSLLLYGFCCLSSNYGILLQEYGLEQYYESYRNIFTTPYTSFPVSLLWIPIGRVIVQKQNEISQLNISWLKVSFIVCLMLLYGEYFIITYNKLAIANDCYIMLIPVCILAILIFGKMKIDISSKFNYRKVSTIVFCCHFPIGIVFRFIFKHFGIQMDAMVFLITIILSLSIAYIILKLKHKILKFAY